MQIFLVLLVFLVTPAAAQQVAPDVLLPDPAQEAEAMRIARTLRCVVCQGESIAESNAPLAADMRALVRRMVAEGADHQAVESFMRQRYGDVVLLRPPLQGALWLLWLAPLLGVVVGGLAVARVMRRHRLGDQSSDSKEN